MREYATVDKSAWPDGAWKSEPDKIQYVDEKSGLDCLVVRSFHTGALCGYVGVPKSHPAFKKRFTEVDVNVHGGLTFSNLCDESAQEGEGICHLPEPGRPEIVWWLGFDCGHAFDLMPALGLRMTYGTYRDIEFVKQENRDLAAQLAEMR